MSSFISEHYDGELYISKFKHPRSLKLLMDSCSPEEFQLMMELSSSALEQFNATVNSSQHTELIQREVARHTEIFEKERKRLEDHTKTLIQTHRAELDSIDGCHTSEKKRLQAGLEAAEFSIQKMREQFDVLGAQSESMIKTSIEQIVMQKDIKHEQESKARSAQYEKEIAARAAQYEREISGIKASNRDALERMESQAKERVTQCDSQHKETISRMQELYSEQESRVRKELEKSYNSSNKGAHGEKEFEDIVAEFVKWPKLVNTSKISHATDRSCKIRNCETFFEIKNYSADVPSKEVVKFERDMEEHQDVPLGVFISMNTNIVGKNSDHFITMKWTSKSQMLVYVNSFYKHSPEEILLFIDMCADYAWAVFNKANDATDTISTVVFENRIEGAKVYIEKEMKRMAEFLRDVNHDKTFLIDSITKQNARYTYHIDQSKQALNGMLEILLGKFDVDTKLLETPPTPVSYTPEPVKRKGSKKSPGTV